MRPHQVAVLSDEQMVPDGDTNSQPVVVTVEVPAPVAGSIRTSGKGLSGSNRQSRWGAPAIIRSLLPRHATLFAPRMAPPLAARRVMVVLAPPPMREATRMVSPATTRSRNGPAVFGSARRQRVLPVASSSDSTECSSST